VADIVLLSRTDDMFSSKNENKREKGKNQVPLRFKKIKVPIG